MVCSEIPNMASLMPIVIWPIPPVLRQNRSSLMSLIVFRADSPERASQLHGGGSPHAKAQDEERHRRRLGAFDRDGMSRQRL